MPAEFHKIYLHASQTDKLRLDEAAKIIAQVAPDWKETPVTIAARILSAGLANEKLIPELISDIERAKRVEASLEKAERKQRALALLKPSEASAKDEA